MGYIVIWFLFGLVCSSIASAKGRSKGSWFLAGVLFGPFSLAIIFLPKVVGADSKRCKFCAEIIRSEAIKCKHCGSDLATIAHLETSINHEGNTPIHNQTPQEVYNGGNCPFCVSKIDAEQDRCDECGTLLFDYKING